MSSYLILGETGESYSITSNKELKNLCEDYINTVSATRLTISVTIFLLKII